MIRTVHGRGYHFLAPVGSSGATSLDGGGGAGGAGGELERLSGLYGRAAQGRRQLVFVTGEPGIGKTTLVDAFRRSRPARRGLVARGQCIEHRGASQPYLPVFDALARLSRDDGRA